MFLREVSMMGDSFGHHDVVTFVRVLCSIIHAYFVAAGLVNTTHVRMRTRGCVCRVGK